MINESLFAVNTSEHISQKKSYCKNENTFGRAMHARVARVEEYSKYPGIKLG